MAPGTGDTQGYASVEARPRMASVPGYEEDLAFVHQDGFTDLAEAAARMLHDFVSPPALVVDLGCGGGTLLRALLDSGFSGHGVDLSPAMIDLAAHVVPEATLAVGDAFAVEIPRCDAVTAVGEVFNYAFVEHGEADVQAAFRRIHDALNPGGVFLFDVATLGRAGNGPTQAKRAGKGWRVEARAEEADGWLTRTIDTWRNQPDGTTRHTQEVHRLRLMDPTWVMDALAAAGFAAEHLGGFDDFGFQEGWDGFLATKPAQPGPA